MEKKDIKQLLQFVVDSNKQSIFELVTAKKYQIDDQQLRQLINVVESTTKDCFYKVMAATK